MENNNHNTDANAVKQEVRYTVVERDYMVTLINHILEMKKEIKALSEPLAERERLIDAHEVKYKYDIGRDLLTHYRKSGLKYITIGRKYFYKSSDIIEFARKAMNQKYENKHQSK